MSNPVVVASDMIVPCNCPLDSGQRASAHGARAGGAVAFAESAPLVKVREEFSTGADAAQGHSLTDRSSVDDACESEATSHGPFMGSTDQLLWADHRRPAVPGQGGALKQKPGGPVAEMGLDVTAVLVDGTPITVDTTLLEATAQQTASEGMEDISEAAGLTCDSATPLVGIRPGTGQIVAGDGTSVPTEGILAVASDKSVAGGVVSQTLVGNEISDADREGSAQMVDGADSVPTTMGTPAGPDAMKTEQGDASSQVVSEKGIPRTGYGADNNVASVVPGANPGLDGPEAVDEVGAGSIRPNTGVDQAGRVRELMPAEIKDDADGSKQVNRQSQATASQGSNGGDASETNVSGEVVQVRQGGRASYAEAQTIGHAYQRTAQSDGSSPANEIQAASAGAVSKANPSDVTVERPERETGLPVPSSGSVVSGSPQSPNPTASLQDPGMSAGQVQVAQVSERSEEVSQLGKEAVSAATEVTAHVEEVQTPASQRPAESLWSSSETGTTPFKSSAESVSQQIADSVQVSLGRGEKEIVIRLNPPELGSVSVRLEDRGDGITGIVEVSKGETRREIEQALPQVIQSLQEAGVQVRRLDLTMTDQPERDFGREQLQQDASSQQSFHRQSEQGQSWPSPDFATSGIFQQDISDAAATGESSGDWTRDRIDMLV